MTPRALVNPAYDPAAVAPPSDAARAFHAGLPGFVPTPLRDLPALATELGVGVLAVKDESDRLGLPAFKILGASWAVECALGAADEAVTTLVCASAGNHGRAVARAAALRGLACRVFLPARSVAARRQAIAGEGAEVVVVDGGYEEAVGAAVADGEREGVLLVADVGADGPAAWVVDGYATLFAEIAEAAEPFDVLLVPAGVGSLAAAAARFGAARGTRVVAAEPVAAACLTASLAAGEPVTIATPGTSMAGLDCAEVSVAAWPDLLAGIAGTVTVSDAEAVVAMRDLAAAGLRIGDCGAATLAAARALADEEACGPLREVVGWGPDTRLVLVATEGATDPEAYARHVAFR